MVAELMSSIFYFNFYDSPSFILIFILTVEYVMVNCRKSWKLVWSYITPRVIFKSNHNFI